MSDPIIASPTLAVIYGNLDFFPEPLVTEARSDVAKIFPELDPHQHPRPNRRD